MEQKIAPQARLHPLLGIAAISVIGVSLAGIGVLTGVLPHPLAATSQPTLTAPAAASSATAALVAAASADPVKLPPIVEAETVRPSTQKPKATAPKKVAATHPASNTTVAATTPPTPPAPSPLAEPPAPPAAVVPPPPGPLAAAPKPACADCGTVENFRELQVKGDGSPLGAIAGGAAGALLGHQFGRGNGKDLLTIAGAVGGAFAGHEVEKRVRTKTRYEITVRMEDGSLRKLTQDSAPAWRVGDRVRVVDQHIVANT